MLCRPETVISRGQSSTARFSSQRNFTNAQAIGKAIRPTNTPKRPKAYNSPISAKKNYSVESLVRLPIRCGRNKIVHWLDIGQPPGKENETFDPTSINSRSAVSPGGILTLVSSCGLMFTFGPGPTGSRVDYRVAMPCLLPFYLPRILVPDRRKIEDRVKKAIQ